MSENGSASIFFSTSQSGDLINFFKNVFTVHAFGRIDLFAADLNELTKETMATECNNFSTGCRRMGPCFVYESRGMFNVSS